MPEKLPNFSIYKKGKKLINDHARGSRHHRGSSQKIQSLKYLAVKCKRYSLFFFLLSLNSLRYKNTISTQKSFLKLQKDLNNNWPHLGNRLHSKYKII